MSMKKVKFLLLQVLGAFQLAALDSAINLPPDEPPCICCSELFSPAYASSREEERADQTITYHVFTADRWQQLEPFESAKMFWASNAALSSFSFSTQQSQLTFSNAPCYARVIAEQDGRLYDLARLMTFACRASENSPFNSKKRTPYAPVSPEVWQQVEPYLMPLSHPVIKTLDQLCSQSRFLASEQSLEAAGFKIIYKQLNQGIIVASNAKIPGYIFKMYLDSSPRTEWPLWILRARGAKIIQEILDKYYYNYYMKVPKKWIYPVTSRGRPSPDATTFPKDFILVVQDMGLVSKDYNRYCYKESMTRSRLKALFHVIDEGGLSDAHIENVPFARDQKIAFIDTEYVHSWPVHFDWLTNYFSPALQAYWLRLIQRGLHEP